MLAGKWRSYEQAYYCRGFGPFAGVFFQRDLICAHNPPRIEFRTGGTTPAAVQKAPSAAPVGRISAGSAPVVGSRLPQVIDLGNGTVLLSEAEYKARVAAAQEAARQQALLAAQKQAEELKKARTEEEQARVHAEQEAARKRQEEERVRAELAEAASKANYQVRLAERNQAQAVVEHARQERAAQDVVLASRAAQEKSIRAQAVTEWRAAHSAPIRIVGPRKAVPHVQLTSGTQQMSTGPTISPSALAALGTFHHQMLSVQADEVVERRQTRYRAMLPEAGLAASASREQVADYIYEILQTPEHTWSEEDRVLLDTHAALANRIERRMESAADLADQELIRQEQLQEREEAERFAHHMMWTRQHALHIFEQRAEYWLTRPVEILSQADLAFLRDEASDVSTAVYRGLLPWGARDAIEDYLKRADAWRAAYKQRLLPTKYKSDAQLTAAERALLEENPSVAATIRQEFAQEIEHERRTLQRWQHVRGCAALIPQASERAAFLAYVDGCERADVRRESGDNDTLELRREIVQEAAYGGYSSFHRTLPARGVPPRLHPVAQSIGNFYGNPVGRVFHQRLASAVWGACADRQQFYEGVDSGAKIDYAADLPAEVLLLAKFASNACGMHRYAAAEKAVKAVESYATASRFMHASAADNFYDIATPFYNVLEFCSSEKDNHIRRLARFAQNLPTNSYDYCKFDAAADYLGQFLYEIACADPAVRNDILRSSWYRSLYSRNFVDHNLIYAFCRWAGEANDNIVVADVIGHLERERQIDSLLRGTQRTQHTLNAVHRTAYLYHAAFSYAYERLRQEEGAVRARAAIIPPAPAVRDPLVAGVAALVAPPSAVRTPAAPLTVISSAMASPVATTVATVTAAAPSSSIVAATSAAPTYVVAKAPTGPGAITTGVPALNTKPATTVQPTPELLPPPGAIALDEGGALEEKGDGPAELIAEIAPPAMVVDGSYLQELYIGGAEAFHRMGERFRHQDQHEQAALANRFASTFYAMTEGAQRVAIAFGRGMGAGAMDVVHLANTAATTAVDLVNDPEATAYYLYEHGREAARNFTRLCFEVLRLIPDESMTAQELLEIGERHQELLVMLDSIPAEDKAEFIGRLVGNALTFNAGARGVAALTQALRATAQAGRAVAGVVTTTRNLESRAAAVVGGTQVLAPVEQVARSFEAAARFERQVAHCLAPNQTAGAGEFIGSITHACDDIELCLRYTVVVKNGDPLFEFYKGTARMHEAHVQEILRAGRHPLLKPGPGIPRIRLVKGEPLIEVPIVRIDSTFPFVARDVEQAAMLGEAWVGKGYGLKKAEDGTWIWKSAKTLEGDMEIERQFRFPSKKKSGLYQANFEESIKIEGADGATFLPVRNMHLTVLKPS